MRASSCCVAVAILFAAASPASSQSAPQGATTTPCPAIGGGGSGSGGGRSTQRVFNFRPPYIMVKGLPGAPYSGQVSTQSSQTTANGTHLAQPARLQPKIYRDSQGRTRIDAMTTQLALSAPQIGRLAEILDSVAGYRYILDDFHKVAYRTTPCMWPVGSGADTSATLAPAAAARGITRNSEDLGTQTMSGVTVIGTRYTTTFPAGTYQNNDQPVTTVEEQWRSAQFGISFLTKNSDPERESTQTMTKFTAGEPDPALFQVPPGYQIVDEAGQFTITIPNQAQ